MIAQVIVDVVHSHVDRPFAYAVPEGMALGVGSRVRVPLGAREVDGLVVGLLPDGEPLPDGLSAARLRPIVRALEGYPAVLPPLLDLARELCAEAHCPLSEALRLMLPAALRQGRAKAQSERYAQLVPGVDAEQAALAQKRAPKRATLLRLLSDGEPHALTELTQLVAAPREALERLEADGLIATSSREVFRAPYEQMEAERTLPPPLTAEQGEALHAMLPSLQRGEGAFLLYGVTGSGKTEVYLAMAQRALAAGRGAIILVPEIALTPQMVRWFRQRFGPQTAVLHSRLTDGQRVDEWRRIRRGDARVVIGARSAVFAPVERLGLIVVDEEHESTYISDHHPRYDARRVAASRCRREGATLVLSSATPSVLSFAMARRGDYTLVEMPSRVLGRPMPAVTLVDMRLELAAGNRSLFSLCLQQKLEACLARGQQAMLFLNRRGYNTFVSCRSCGYVVRCDNCDLAMTLHQTAGEGKGEMRCHLCGATREPPAVCPQCASPYIRFFGAGTQRVEEEMRKRFPNVKTIRMDLDTTRKRDAHYQLLTAFREGRAQVLIGTQMIAKGLDFPNVTLVGVVAADMTLNLPDYRAPERTFQLITQVAGRAGRATQPGEVVVQTYAPDAPCIKAAVRQDYRAFFETEFSRRRTGLYPPFTSIARLLVESESEDAARALCERLYEALSDFLRESPAQKRRVLFIRQDAAPVSRIRGKYRFHVLLRMFEHPDAAPVLRLMADLARVGGEGCMVYLEIDPVTLM